MNKITKAFHRGEKGFTLIELLIVIVILGILAAVAIPQVTKFIKQGKISAMNSETALVNTAIGAAMSDAQLSTFAGGSLAPAAGAVPAVDCLVLAGSAGPPTVDQIYVGDYIQGSSGSVTPAPSPTHSANLVIPIKATYTISTTGIITAATYTGSGLTWTSAGGWQ